MGTFDRTLCKYNDAIPHFGEDGVDIVKCDDLTCCYRDTKTKSCLFETCIVKNNPYAIPFHSLFTHKCKICDNEYTIDTTKTQPLVSTIEYEMCPVCIEKLKKLLR